jgi:hypothetical protein
MKKLIFAFVIAFTTGTFAQTGKKTEAKSSKTEKTTTECYSTKESIPLTCVKVEEKETEKNNLSVEKAPAVKPEKKIVVKEDKKPGSAGPK